MPRLSSGDVTEAIIRKPCEALATTMPVCRTASGRRGSARATRFWTRTWAVSRSVPGWKVTVMATEPSEVEDEVTYSIPSTPLISCSIGAATVSARVSAEAPGNAALTVIVGGAISGYCDRGSSG